jgi:hypothetical protein
MTTKIYPFTPTKLLKQPRSPDLRTVLHNLLTAVADLLVFPWRRHSR